LEQFKVAIVVGTKQFCFQPPTLGGDRWKHREFVYLLRKAMGLSAAYTWAIVGNQALLGLSTCHVTLLSAASTWAIVGNQISATGASWRMNNFSRLHLGDRWKPDFIGGWEIFVVLDYQPPTLGRSLET
jgi:hypothetical protein